MSSENSFFGALFDFSFRSFVTLRIVRFFYILAVLFLVLGLVMAMASGVAGRPSAVETITFVIMAPLGALLYLLAVRVSLELVVVIFRIGETQSQILDHLRAEGGGEEPPATA